MWRRPHQAPLAFELQTRSGVGGRSGSLTKREGSHETPHPIAAAVILLTTPACQVFQPKAKLTVEGTYGPDVKQVNYKLEVGCS